MIKRKVLRGVHPRRRRRIGARRKSTSASIPESFLVQ